jgi:hypothetical protein
MGHNQAQPFRQRGAILWTPLADHRPPDGSFEEAVLNRAGLPVSVQVHHGMLGLGLAPGLAPGLALRDPLHESSSWVW